MQAVILAGGKGTRLAPLTDSIPKPLVMVAGKPIMEHTLSILPDEITDVIVIIGYRGKQVEEYFGGMYGNKRLTYVFQSEQKGTGHALLLSRPYLRKGTFIILSGDDLYHEDDLKAVMGEEPMVLVAHSKTPERFGSCVVSESGQLEAILEKQKKPPSNIVNIGAYVLNHEIFDVPVPVLPNGELNLAEQVGNWAKKRPVYVHEAKFWMPVNNPDELKSAENLLK